MVLAEVAVARVVVGLPLAAVVESLSVMVSGSRLQRVCPLALVWRSTDHRAQFENSQRSLWRHCLPTDLSR